MNIGHMDRRIELQTSAHTVNQYGERTDSWSTYATYTGEFHMIVRYYDSV